MKWWTFVDIWTMFIVHWKCKWWCKTLQRLERSSEVEEAIAEENESFQSEKEVACFAVISVIVIIIITAGCGRMHPTLHWSRHWLRDGEQAEDALPCRPPAQVPQQLPLMFFKALHETFKETWSMTTGHWLVTLNVKYFGITFSRLNHSGESLQTTLWNPIVKICQWKLVLNFGWREEVVWWLLTQHCQILKSALLSRPRPSQLGWCSHLNKGFEF